jgi:hypothetical protein
MADKLGTRALSQGFPHLSIASGIPDPAHRDELSATIENLSNACALRSQEADVQDGTVETWREEEIHDSAYGCKRLPYLVRFDQSEQIYAMRAEGTEPSSLIAGETGLKRSRALITQSDPDGEVKNTLNSCLASRLKPSVSGCWPSRK